MPINLAGAVWRVETAPRAAVFVDVADYYAAARSAMGRARRSIHLLNWAFEAQTPFTPSPGGGASNDERFGDVLKTLADNPALDVRILCWQSALPVAATQNFFPIADRKFFQGSAVKFVLDGKLPLGACHHQKMIVIDDQVAFCGGADIGPDRWDTPAHLDDDSRRRPKPDKAKTFDSRHEVMALVDGPAAAALGALFRQRWERATAEDLAPASPTDDDAWPPEVTPTFHQTPIAVSRTLPAWKEWPQVRESEALTLASIAAAKTCIYMENQYFTSPLVAEALAARLGEPDGPEVVLVSTQHSPSWFDQMTMDRTRSNFIRRLVDEDRYGRFRIYSPVTTLGRIIIVHAKVAIIDDELLRIGSANMNNRSTGFDTECDVSLVAQTAGDGEARAAIGALRGRLIAHWLGCGPEEVEQAVSREGSLSGAIDALRSAGRCRLRPIPTTTLGPLATFIATFHLGDPLGPGDAFRPWKRRQLLNRRTHEKGPSRGTALSPNPDV